MLKPMEIYGAALAEKLGVPPGSSQMKTYTAMCEVFAMMLKDATVTVTVKANPENPPPSGLHVIVMGAPVPVTGADDCTGKIT